MSDGTVDVDVEYEYRVLNRTGTTTSMPYDAAPIRDVTVAEAGVVWLAHIYPGLAPYRIERREYRISDWEPVEQGGER